MVDFRGNKIYDGDLVIKTTYDDKKAILTYCVFINDKPFYLREDYIINVGTTFRVTNYNGSVASNQLIKIFELSEEEERIRIDIIKLLSEIEEAGRFGKKSIEIAKEILADEIGGEG